MEKIIPIQEKKLEELTDAVDRLGGQLRHKGQKGDFSYEVPLKELEESVGKLELSPLAPIIKQLEAVAADAAVKLGKQVQCEWSGFDFEISHPLKDSLFTALAHAVRNSVDHGLESPKERVAKGKNAFGKIKFLAKLSGGCLEVRVRDDGRGVDYSKLTQKAIQMGIHTPAGLQKLLPREILSLLFTPGFSTSREVTVVSGRGIGLDAVKAFAEENQGQAMLQEILPHGLELLLRIPLTQVGLEVVPISLGSEMFWFRPEAFELITPSKALGWVRIPFIDALGIKNKSKPGKILRFCTEFSSPEVLEVETIGSPQFKVFRPLDPVWNALGPPWLTRWIQACEGHTLACRAQKDKASIGLSLLADPEVIYSFMTNSVAQN